MEASVGFKTLTLNFITKKPNNFAPFPSMFRPLYSTTKNTNRFYKFSLSRCCVCKFSKPVFVQLFSCFVCIYFIFFCILAETGRDNCLPTGVGEAVKQVSAEKILQVVLVSPQVLIWILLNIEYKIDIYMYVCTCLCKFE